MHKVCHKRWSWLITSNCTHSKDLLKLPSPYFHMPSVIKTHHKNTNFSKDFWIIYIEFSMRKEGNLILQRSRLQ